MRRAFKYRLYPNVTQAKALASTLETHRRLYNACLEERKAAYETEQRSVTFGEQRESFNADQKTHAYYRFVNNNSAHTTIKRLDLAFQAFFRRVKAGEAPGYPRFKGRDRFDSIPFGTYPNGARLTDDRLAVQHVGRIKVKLHRPVQGTIKTVVLKREADKWYVVFSCDLGEVEIQPSTNPPIGIDLGLSSFLTTSEGKKEPNPRCLKDALPELRRKQRGLSRKKKGGTNRRKARKAVARLHTRVKNLRKEHHHETALKLVRRFGTVAVENLDVVGMLTENAPGMTKSQAQRMRRAISDAAWGGFVSTLKCKAESAGVSVVSVDPRGTTQECSGCGTVVPKTLRDRWHECPACGLSLDRDHNAALNVLHRALPESLGRIAPAGAKPGVALVCPRSADPSADRSFKDPAATVVDQPKTRRKSPKAKVLEPVAVAPTSVNATEAKPRKKLQPGRTTKKAPAAKKKPGSVKPVRQRSVWD